MNLALGSVEAGEKPRKHLKIKMQTDPGLCNSSAKSVRSSTQHAALLLLRRT